MVRELGITTLLAVYALNLAASYCDRLYVMSASRVVTGGEVADVLTPALIEQIFGVSAFCGPTRAPDDGTWPSPHSETLARPDSTGSQLADSVRLDIAIARLHAHCLIALATGRRSRVSRLACSAALLGLATAHRGAVYLQ